MKKLVYRIVGMEDWRMAQATGKVPKCGSDQASGFVHLSGADTLLETAALYFEPSEEPVALEIDAALLGDALKWEKVKERGGALFPHLYGQIDTQVVHAMIVLETEASGGYRLGERQSVI